MSIATKYCVHDQGVMLGIADLLFTCVKSQSLWCVHAYLSNVKRAPLGLGRSLGQTHSANSLMPLYIHDGLLNNGHPRPPAPISQGQPFTACYIAHFQAIEDCG